MKPAFALLLMSGCLAQPQLIESRDAQISTNDDGGTQPVVLGDGPYCQISAAVLVPKCTACHRPGGNPPDLTFEAGRDIVGASSTLYPGKTLVAAGDPAGSLLLRKLKGTQAANEGVRMPIGATLTDADIALVEAWIQGGAPTSCDAVQGDGGVVRYHPADFALPAQHGLALTSGAQDCRSCHGATLTGAGATPSCDSCHTGGTAWRTNCTFCHGTKIDDMTPGSGAPPRGLLGQLARNEQTFWAHTEHVSVRNHRAYDCTECHIKPTEVLSTDHVFDSTPGTARVTFELGLSRGGTYDDNGGCSNMYCHGNGQAPNGSMRHDAPRPDCNGCHAGPGATEARRRTMSGLHDKHLGEGLQCSECHSGTLDSSNTISNPLLHVNGAKDVVLPAGMSRAANNLCSGSCHGELHDRSDWFAADD